MARNTKTDRIKRAPSRLLLMTAAALLLIAGLFCPAGGTRASLLKAAEASAEELPSSGKWGDDTWTFDTETGTLTFEGEGYLSEGWDEAGQFEPILSQIRTIVIGEGITDIGAFYLDNLTGPVSLVLPASLSGTNGFFFNNGNEIVISDIQVAKGSTHYEVRDGALIDKDTKQLACLPACVDQETYTLPDDLTSIDMMAFLNTRVQKLILHDHMEFVSGLTWGRGVDDRSDGTLGDLKEVWLYTLKAPSTNNWLSINQDLTVHVPKGSLGYDTEVWSKCTLVRDLEGEIDPADLRGRCGENAFWTVTEDGVLTITGSGAMYDYSVDVCIQDSALTRWNGLHHLSDGRFIREIHIGEGITHIGSWAFTLVNGITEMSIPDSVTSIGEQAFGGCDNLKKITIPDSVETIGAWAFWATSLEEIRLPAKLKTVSDGLCKNCNSMLKITLPEGLTEIGREAFYECSEVTELIIPETVTRIGDRALTHCYGLRTLLFEGPMPVLSDNLFEESEPRIHINGRYYFDSGTWKNPNDYDGYISWLGNCREHQWQDDEVLKEATWDDEGLMRRRCPQCGQTREVVIPKAERPVAKLDVTLSRTGFVYDGHPAPSRHYREG